MTTLVKKRVQYTVDQAIMESAEYIMTKVGLTPATVMSMVYAEIARTGKIPVTTQVSDEDLNTARLIAMSGKRIYYEMTEQMSAPRSLGLMDPLSVVWELIPYSFVVDWFIPIGTYLENLNTIPSLRGRFMTTTLRRFSGSAVSISPSYKWAVVPTTHTSQVFLDRKISTSLSVPKPSFNSFEDAMSPKRIWNAIALAVQRF